MDLAARCINVSRVEIDYDLLAQELKNTYDSNKDRQGLFSSGDRGPTNFKAGFRDGVLVLGGQTQTELRLQVGLIVIDDFTASYYIRAYITGSEVGPVDATDRPLLGPVGAISLSRPCRGGFSLVHSNSGVIKTGRHPP